MWDDDETVEISYDRLIHTTYDRAGDDYAYRIDFGVATEWIPASQCEIDAREKIVEMPVWLAEEKELV